MIYAAGGSGTAIGRAVIDHHDAAVRATVDRANGAWPRRFVATPSSSSSSRLDLSTLMAAL
ncbi:MAG TPA: hypothetical protein VF183_12390 [Acidimicrobiales bacterium]